MKSAPPYLIAEIGVNFYDIALARGMSPLDGAKLMIREASAAGADAVKFQTYKAAKLAARHSPAYWDRDEEPTASQYELFKKYDRLGPRDYAILARYCRTLGIDFMSTPFDLEAVRFLAPLVPHFKVASADITNVPLLEAVARMRKPLFISTGASTIGEIQEALRVIRGVAPRAVITLMHCVLSYPTAVRHANLRRITALAKIFPDCRIGYSDHTRPDRGMAIATAAYLLGARAIEKHFTLDKTLPGNDHYHAMDPSDLRLLAENLRVLGRALAERTLDVQPCEVAARMHARRSIVLRRSVRKGQRLRQSDLIMKRPGTGLAPPHLPHVVGRAVRHDLAPDTILTLNHLV